MSESDAETRLVDRARAVWRGIALGTMAVVGTGVAAALALTLSDANHQRDRALALQSHSYDVMILTRTLSASIARAEGSLGRYVISGDKQLGRQYYEQWEDAGQQIERLSAVTGDNDRQRQAIERLRAAYRDRGAELSVTALSTSYGKNSQAYARYYQAGISPSLRRINTLLDSIIANEHDLLDRRSGEALKSVERSNAIARVLAVFGLLIVIGAIVLGWLTTRAMEERAVARTEADSERQRVAQLEEAVGEATSALHAQEAKLRQVQKMEAVGQLTGGIAHDFNNMLAVVLGGLELARRASGGADRDAVVRHLDNATEGANRAATLTRRLLAFSREQALHPEPLRPTTAIAGMSDLLDRTLGDQVVVTSSDDGSGWHIWADRHELENALLNLAVNARDAMDGRGTLTIRTFATELAANEIGRVQAGAYVGIAITDTGCGMTPDVLDRVFEPFFTTKPVGKGTGLGLSQIFAFARQSGGEIAIGSEVDRGTTVTLYLPRHVGGTDAAAAPETEMFLPEVAPLTGLGVLLVEDDPRVRNATQGALVELGHRVVPCGDPLDAPRMIDDLGPFDIVISDVLMPGQTGPEMVADLVKRRPDLAVLFVTGYAGDGSAADFGGRPVLRKPFTLVGLERAIVEAMAFERPDAPDRMAAE